MAKVLWIKNNTVAAVSCKQGQMDDCATFAEIIFPILFLYEVPILCVLYIDVVELDNFISGNKYHTVNFIKNYSKLHT